MSIRSWLRNHLRRKPVLTTTDWSEIPPVTVTRARAAEARRYLDEKKPVPPVPGYVLGRERAEEMRLSLDKSVRVPIRRQPVREHGHAEIDLDLADVVESVVNAATIVSTPSAPPAEPVHHHTIYHDPAPVHHDTGTTHGGHSHDSGGGFSSGDGGGGGGGGDGGGGGGE